MFIVWRNVSLKKIGNEREVLSIPLTNGSVLTMLNVSIKGAQVKENKQASSFIAIYVADTVGGTQATQ